MMSIRPHSDTVRLNLAGRNGRKSKKKRPMFLLEKVQQQAHIETNGSTQGYRSGDMIQPHLKEPKTVAVL